jgi:hypothetical protein
MLAEQYYAKLRDYLRIRNTGISPIGDSWLFLLVLNSTPAKM